MLSILIVFYNRSSATIRLVESLLKYPIEGAFEILIYDNASHPEEFKKLAAFADSLRGSTGMPKPNAVVVQKDNDVTIYLDNGSRIFVTRNADFAEARVNLESVLDSSEFKERTPGKFDYIDLRFGNKVYFK